MNYTYFLLKLLAFKAKAFVAATRDPQASQERVLFEYLKRNKATEYGLKHDFAGVQSVAGYQTCVPLNNYKTIRPYIDRLAAGEKNLLTVDPPIFFDLTSGTTGKPKLIPVTQYSSRRNAGIMTIWAYHIAMSHPGTLNGKILAVVSQETEGYTKAGIPCGAARGHAYQNLPALIKHFYVLPHEIFSIKDFEARYYCILRIALAHNVTTFATLNPNTAVLLCRKIAGWQERIIDDIEKGTLDENLDIPADTREAIEKRLRPNTVRAAVLRRILDEKKELLPKDFWPDLELIECWKAGTMKLYLKEISVYFGDVSVRDIGCLSTEARSSIPTSDRGASGVLAINTNFYEFIPAEDMEKEDKRFLLCFQLEKGKQYCLVVTTPSGLYRYNTDDIILVTGFLNRTPLIEFVQKRGDVVSLAGEKLYGSQVNKAVHNVLERRGLMIDFFCACMEKDTIPYYAFLVEFARDPSFFEKKGFLSDIEKELCACNREYEYARAAQLLSSPVLLVVAKGEFEKYRIKRVKEGAHDGQFKVPELTADPDFRKNFTIKEKIELK